MAPFENFCDLQFEIETSWICFDGPLYILHLCWEVKNDVSDQSKDALRVCYVNIRKSLLGQNGAHVHDFFAYQSLVSSDLNFFMALLLTINLAIAKRFWLIPNRSRQGCHIWIGSKFPDISLTIPWHLTIFPWQFIKFFQVKKARFIHKND